MKKTMLRGVSALLLCCVVLVSGYSSAFAATPTVTKPTTVNDTNTLKVSPVRTDLSIQQGQSAVVKTIVTNLTASPIVIHPIENDFISGDENGTPSIILDENSYAPTHSLKRFMVPLQNITIPANSARQVDVTISVPKTAQAGGYYGAIRFAPASSDGTKSVNLSASVASLILMTVPGPTTEKVVLTNFDTQQFGASASNFRTPDDITLLVRFQNKGNVQETPFGQIYVKKGKKVVYTYNFNQSEPKDNVLPDSARRWTVPLKGFSKFGKYTVGATFTYGSNNQSIDVSKTVWIVPTTYIFGAIGGVVGLIAIILIIFFSLRAYKRKILRSSNHRRRY